MDSRFKGSRGKFYISSLFCHLLEHLTDLRYALQLGSLKGNELLGVCGSVFTVDLRGDRP